MDPDGLGIKFPQSPLGTAEKEIPTNKSILRPSINRNPPYEHCHHARAVDCDSPSAIHLPCEQGPHCTEAAQIDPESMRQPTDNIARELFGSWSGFIPALTPMTERASMLTVDVDPLKPEVANTIRENSRSVNSGITSFSASELNETESIKTAFKSTVWEETLDMGFEDPNIYTGALTRLPYGQTISPSPFRFRSLPVYGFHQGFGNRGGGAALPIRGTFSSWTQGIAGEGQMSEPISINASSNHFACNPTEMRVSVVDCTDHCEHCPKVKVTRLVNREVGGRGSYSSNGDIVFLVEEWVVKPGHVCGFSLFFPF